jgi:hypothetical protein
MTTTEIITAIISFLALIVSAITAYRTFFARFQGEVFLKPRVVLNRINEVSSIVVGCEISNRGAQAGIVDDIVLVIKHRQQHSKSMNTYSFLPLLVREDYSVFKSYKETDFEPFQSISVPSKSRLTRYIVFSPSSESFSPQAGEIELQLFSRNSNKPKWHEARGRVTFLINESHAATWQNPKGQGIMIEAVENSDLRANLMDKVFS